MNRNCPRAPKTHAPDALVRSTSAGVQHFRSPQITRPEPLVALPGARASAACRRRQLRPCSSTLTP